jgi:hypothetical protein
MSESKVIYVYQCKQGRRMCRLIEVYRLLDVKEADNWTCPSCANKGIKYLHYRVG